MGRRTFVLADLHLVRRAPPGVAGDLAGLVRAHPGARFIVAGDLLDRSAEPVPLPTLDEALTAHPEARAALGEHVTRGGDLWIAGGNHDAELGADSAADELARALLVPAEARPRLRTTPWFFREGGLHVEHGHVFDPDNAPAHPLSAGESLGVHFVRAFIAPSGAHAFLNANDGTPLHLFWSSFRWYGARAPYIVYRFFHAAATSLLRSGPRFPGAAERSAGAGREGAFAEEHGVRAELVATLARSGARPTLESTARTFARLYLDRVAATLAIGGGLGVAAAAHARGASPGGVAMLSATGLVAAAIGATAMGASWARGHDRYGGSVATRLSDGAARVASTTGARLVVFGHAHRETDGAAYANTGSFAFPHGAPGRPYLEIEGALEAPRAVRRWLRA